MRLLFLLLIIVVVSCNNRNPNPDSSKTDSLTSSIVPVKKISLDTTSIINEIKKQYQLINKKKASARMETDYNHVSNDDIGSPEYNGDYSITSTWDTAFYISGNLSLDIYIKEEENQMGNFHHRTESYYNNNELFFTFYKELKDMPFMTENSSVTEIRTYYYQKKVIRCLSREIVGGDIESLKDSIGKVVLVKCI